MKKVFLYVPENGESPFLRFLTVLEPKLRAKLVQGICSLPTTPMTEPHVKHFSLERYASLRMLEELKQGTASLVEYTGKEVVG